MGCFRIIVESIYLVFSLGAKNPTIYEELHPHLGQQLSMLDSGEGSWLEVQWANNLGSFHPSPVLAVTSSTLGLKMILVGYLGGPGGVCGSGFRVKDQVKGFRRLQAAL